MFVLLASPANWNELQQQIVQHGACAVPITGPVPPQFEFIHLLFSYESQVFAQADGQVAQVLAGSQLVVLFDTETRQRLGAIRVPIVAAEDTAPPRAQATPGVVSRPISQPTYAIPERPDTRPTPAIPGRPTSQPTPAVAARPISGPLPSIPTRPITQPSPSVANAPFGGYGALGPEALTPPDESGGPGVVAEDDPLAQTTPAILRAGAEEPAWKRYETLSRAEKIHLAKYGNADERRLILRDRDTSIHAFVLTNPGFGAQELAALFKSGQVSGQFVLRVCERRELYQNPTVAEALVFHPQTPIDLAERLVALLPVEVVRRIAKQGNLRLQIVTAARKRVLSR